MFTAIARDPRTGEESLFAAQIFIVRSVPLDRDVIMLLGFDLTDQLAVEIRLRRSLENTESALKEMLDLLRRQKDLPEDITPTERSIAKMIKQGKTSKEIADAVNISVNTVNTHRQNIRKKLHLDTYAALSLELLKYSIE